MNQDELYRGREQTKIKHFILAKYLERFAFIIGSHWNTISYVDCFSGPWNVQSEALADSSFAIALKELRKAREFHRSRGKAVHLRCLFLEKDPERYQRLKQFAHSVSDADVEALNSELADSINDIVRFIKQGGSQAFPFIFIDPTGWTGFEQNLIAPLLRLRPCEVLINFMTDYVRRFIDYPDQQTQQQFAELFGSPDFKTRIEQLDETQDREDELIRAYADSVRRTGDFDHACTAIILYPLKDRSYFHLIYATRGRKGVEVFKDVERKAMQVQAVERADAKRRKREKRTQQPEMFFGKDLPDTRPIDALRNRYLKRSQERVQVLLQDEERVPFEDAWDLALSFPLVWEADLKEWIYAWSTKGMLRIEGLRPRQRVPKLGEKNVLIWRA